jgi:lipopolysaccharide exporter
VKRWLDLGACRKWIFGNSKSSFSGDVVKLVGGTAFAQVLSILASPIITRIYGPEAYGLSALFTSIAAIIAIIACLRYELAIMLPEKEVESLNLLALSLLLAAMTGVVTAIVFWLSGEMLLELLNAGELRPVIWLIPISVFLSGAFQALNYWNTRTKHFGRLSLARVSASLATTGTQLSAGFAGYATGKSLIVASLLGSAASTLILGGQIWRDDGRRLIASTSLKDIKSGLHRYRRFPLFDTGGAILNSLSWQLPIFLLSAFFSPAVVGYYSLSIMVLQLPSNLISSAVSQVFFQRAAKANLDGKLRQVVEDTFFVLVIIGVLPILLLTMTGEDIFRVIFGQTWAEAGIYSQILAPWMFFVFVTSPLSTVFPILEKQRSFLLFNILLFSTRAGALLLGCYLGDTRVAMLLFSAVGVLNYAGMGLWIFSRVGISFWRMMNSFRGVTIYIIAIAFIIGAAKWALFFSTREMLFLDIIIAVIYCIILIKSSYISFRLNNII